MGVIQNLGLARHNTRSKGTLEFANFFGGIKTDVTNDILPLKYARKMHNFCIKNGALTTGLGSSNLKLPQSLGGNEIEANWTLDNQPKKLYLLRAYNSFQNGTGDRIVVFNSENKMASCFVNTNIGLFLTIPNLQLNSAPKSAVNYTLQNGTDVFLFGSEDDNLKMWNLSNNTVQDCTNLRVTSLCTHYERVFATVGGSRTRIWFSDELDPTNWSAETNAGGYIDLADKAQGGANKIVSFNNYLYVFRDYGITRISAFGSKSSFSVNQIYTSSNAIYANTVCKCGEYIYFMASDGMYTFDGVTTRKVNLGFEEIISAQNAENMVATFYKNKYCLLLNTNLRFILNKGLNTLLTYDIITKEYDILSGYLFYDILGVVSDKVEKLVVIASPDGEENKILQIETNGEMYGEATYKLWESAYTDLGYSANEKSISSISLQTASDVNVKIETEKDKTTLHFEGANKVQRKMVNVSGVMFKITFMTYSKTCEISHPKIEFGLGKPNA